MATLQDLYGNAWQDYYKQPTGGSGWNPNAAGSGQVYRDPATGALIRANYNDQGDITQYFAYDPKNEKPGGQYMAYDPSGKQLGAGEFGSDEATKNLMMFLAAAGGMAFLPGGPLGNAVGGGTSLGQNGAFLGEGVSSGIPAWDGAAAAAGGGAAAGGAGAAAGGAGAGAGAGGAATAAGGAAAGGGLLSGAGSLLGPAATVLGALAGGQGTPGKTEEKRMDPRLDKYVYDDLMPKVQGLLNSQMPLAQQAGAQMRQIGGGLLNAPIAQNGFGLFTKGRY